jgi:chorismate mutase
VEEHGPKRLEQIDGEVSKLNAKIQTLLSEREKVQALVLALKK